MDISSVNGIFHFVMEYINHSTEPREREAAN